MKVYRYLSERELKMYFTGKTDKVGHCYERENMNSPNTFDYKENTRYVHFFRKLKDVKLIKQEHLNQGRIPQNQRYFIACFDIPLKLLMTSIGVGFYQDRTASGYEEQPKSKAIEFAIESSKLKEEYLLYFKQEKLDRELHWKKDEMKKEMK